MSAPARLTPLTLALSTLALATLTACSLTERGLGASPPVPDAGPPRPDATFGDAGPTPPPTVTWFEDIRPLFAAHCAGCHGPDSPTGLDLTDPADWRDGPAWWAAAAVDAVITGHMPPWMPADDCRPIIGDPRLTAGDHALLRRWSAEDFPAGAFDPLPAEPLDPAEPTGPATPPDETLAARDAYVPDFGAGDDHRCLLLGEPLAEPRYIRALDLAAHPAMTRRARLYRVPPGLADDLAALDAEHPGPGYPCAAGPGLDAAELLLARQPDTPPLAFPAGAAVVLDPGDRLVAHLHYTPTGLDPTADVPADAPAAALWLDDGPPADRVRVLGHRVGPIELEPGDTRTTAGAIAIGAPFTLIGVIPQMQTHGRRLEATLDRGGDRACLLRIDDYRPDAQATLLYAPRDWVAAQPGDVHRLRCVHHNDTDRPIGSGDDAGDIDCLVHLVTTAPYLDSDRP